MKQSGQIVLFRFPYTNGEFGKLRPALLLGRLPGSYDDWLICMISSQLQQIVLGFDEMVAKDDSDFVESGLKTESVIRVGRIAVVQGEFLVGAIGGITQERLLRIRKKWVNWFEQTS